MKNPPLQPPVPAKVFLRVPRVFLLRQVQALLRDAEGSLHAADGAFLPDGPLGCLFILIGPSKTLLDIGRVEVFMVRGNDGVRRDEMFGCFF